MRKMCIRDRITNLCGGALSFFDAAAPIVTRESLDMEHCFTASRYDKGDDDYINCPMNKEAVSYTHLDVYKRQVLQ